MAHILVVDDDEVILKVIRAALVKAGHTVVSASDGYMALDSLQRELFDLIVTDANMPGGLSGFSLVATIRKEEKLKNIPIIFLTGRREKQDVERAIRSGVDDYMIKPIDHDIFLAKVENLLKPQKLQHQFQQLPIKEIANWNIELNVTGLSEQGISLTSLYPIPVDIKIRIESHLFRQLGFPTPLIRISSCKQIGLEPPEYTIFGSFIGLSQSELQAIRQWVISKGQSSKAS